MKGVGQGAVEALMTERALRGGFSTLEELCQRMDLRDSTTRARGVIRSGSMDHLGEPGDPDGAPADRHAAR